MDEKNSAVTADIDGLESYRFELREQILSLLFKATRQYKDFTATQTSDDVKSFAAYQAACRTALAHLQLLIKIAEWAHPNTCNHILSYEDIKFDKLILDAHTAIQGMSKSECDF